MIQSRSCLCPNSNRAVYDSLAEAYHIIHNNLHVALEALNICGEDGTLNKNAKAAALSAFESSKQCFFNHMLTAMKCSSLIKAIEADIERGDSMIEHLAGLPAMPTAPDQILHHFGSDAVSEVTGRSLRLIKEVRGNLLFRSASPHLCSKVKEAFVA